LLPTQVVLGKLSNLRSLIFEKKLFTSTHLTILSPENTIPLVLCIAVAFSYLVWIRIDHYVAFLGFAGYNPNCHLFQSHFDLSDYLVLTCSIYRAIGLLVGKDRATVMFLSTGRLN
jgi:hypothetical protein